MLWQPRLIDISISQAFILGRWGRRGRHVSSGIWENEGITVPPAGVHHLGDGTAPRQGPKDQNVLTGSTQYPQAEKPASPCNGSMGVMLRLRMAMQGGYSRVPAQ